jgi:hypothetical protein
LHNPFKETTMIGTVVNKPVEVDIRQFYRRHLGITDSRVLGRLVEYSGRPKHRLDSLEQIRDMILYDRFQDSDELGLALCDALGIVVGKNNMDDLVIETLVGCREFKAVPLVKAIKLYFDGLYVHEVVRLHEVLGAEVPDWLFPAMVRMAHDVRNGRKNWKSVRDTFADRLVVQLKAWGYDTPKLGNFARLIAQVGYYSFVSRRPDGRMVMNTMNE